MKGYTLDTNIVAAHLKRNPLATQRMRDAEATGYPVMLNAVSYYETRRGLLFAGAQTQLAAFERLWRTQGILMIDQTVLDKAADIYADLRATGQLIEDADILIAAIALTNDLALVTNNTAHFSRLTGLHLEDWLSP
jgi:tRNA(fMet)-specific endonuclease VapC